MNRDTIATHVYAAMLSSQQSGMTAERLTSLAGLAVQAADVLAAALQAPPGRPMAQPVSLGGLQVAGVGAGGPQPVRESLQTRAGFPWGASAGCPPGALRWSSRQVGAGLAAGGCGPGAACRGEAPLPCLRRARKA